MLTRLSSGDHERLSRLAALAVGVAAAVTCLYLLVRIVWLLVPRGDSAAIGAASVATSPPGAAVSAAKWHLFGNPQSVAAAPASTSLATVLKLALRGTLALPDSKDERALAIIANEQGFETGYRIGAEVAGGAHLAEVYTDHVVLDHEGIAETLALPRPDQHVPPSAKIRPRTPGATASASSVPPGFPATATSAAPAAGGTAKRIDPQDVARQLKPVFADGRIVGADLSGADTALLSRLGLKPSDVVTAINGTPLAGVSNPQQLMDQLQNSPSIQVTVQRDGKPATLTLSLR